MPQLTVGVLIAVGVLAVSGLGPGHILVRRWRLAPVEALTASIALSLVLVYAVSFALFVVDAPPGANFLLLGACAVLTLVSGRDLGRLLASPEVRPILSWLGIFALWSLALVALIRNYSGGGWYGDWLEHYQRSLFFLDRPSPGVVFQGDYTVPARPPLMNVLCAYVMAIAGRDYAVYQVVSTLLSVLVLLPAWLLARGFARGGRLAVGLLAAFIAFNPMMVQNATYSWTKLLTAFYVVAGLHFYLTGWRGGQFPRVLLGFGCLAAALVAHYSAGPYALFLAGHWIGAVLPHRRDRLRELGAAAAVTSVILLSWFGWSLLHYGVGGSVGATSSVRDAGRMTPAENLSKIALNVRDSIVPHVLRGVGAAASWTEFSWGGIRDAAFKLYQSNLLLGFGSLGLLLLAYSAARRAPPSPGERLFDPPGARFWLPFLAFTVVLGIAVHGTADAIGLAHICLQPLVVVGLACLASSFPSWPRPVRWIATAGLVLDLMAGVLLHFWFQSLTFGGFVSSGGRWSITNRDMLVGSVYANWKLKEKEGLSYLGDALQSASWAVKGLVGALIVGFIWTLIGEASRAPAEKTVAARR